MAKVKAKVQGNYQYSEANLKDASLLRSFGWLVGRRTEHENKKGEKVFTIRRDLDFVSDPILRKAEKSYTQYKDKAQKKMKCRHRWGQFFAILFTIVGLAAGAVLMFGNGIEMISDIVDTLKETVGDLIGADLADTIMEYIPFAFFGIGGISLISIFINKGRYKKRVAFPKRKYAKKYISIAKNALTEGAERVRAMKEDKKYLMTRSDRRLSEIGSTFQRVMDKTNEVEFD